MICRVIWSKDFGAEYEKFLGLFPSSLGLCGDLVVIKGLRSPGFVVCFYVTMIWCQMEKKRKVHGCKGTERCPVLYESEI